MNDFLLILPEVFLALTLVFVVVGEVTHHGESRRLTQPTALIGLVAAAIEILLGYHGTPSQAFNHTLSVDALSLFIKLVAVALAIFSILISMNTTEVEEGRSSEYCVLILAGTLALCFAASATNLILSFVCLQLLCTVCFFLAGYHKRSIRSSEAAIKFFVLNAAFGGLFLFGLALLFSVTKSLNIQDIHQALVQAAVLHPIPGATLSGIFILLLLGLAFPIGTFPIHFWVPDVLEGSPTPASGYLSMAPRLAGFAILIRLFVVAFSTSGASRSDWQVLGGVDWTQPMAIVAGMSMLVGSLLAYRQKSSKRLVASLVISNTGALLLGLITLDEVGISSLLYSLWVELFSLMGIFFVLSIFVDLLQTDELSKLKGALHQALPESVCLVIFLFCFIGFPPLPGFIGRFALVGAVVHHQGFALAAICALSMAVSAAAVARLAYGLIGDYGHRTSPAPTRGADGSNSHFRRRLYLGLLALPLVLSGIFAQALFDWAGRSLGFIFW